jgi:hypothetical protein
MKERTPPGRPTTPVERICSRVESLIFREPDLDAIARGWQVRRERPFHRVYRDPRWDSISACTGCHGSGLSGTAACGDCDGRGTVRTGTDTVGVR